MKKTLVALAALASVSAFAQSSVSITGLVDLGLNRIDYKGNVVTTTGAPNGSATSNFTFLINEDLGGGLKAAARWEIDPDLTQTVGKTSGTSATGTTSNVTSFLGNGYSFLSLRGGFGEVKAGSLNFVALDANGDGNLGLGTAVGSGYRVSSFDAVRAQNSFQYITPSFNGLTVSYLLSEKNDLQANANTGSQTGNQVNQTNGRDKVSELGLAYIQGPLAVRYSALTTEQWGDVSYSTVSGVGYGAQTWINGTGAQFKLGTLSAKYDISSQYSVAYFNQIAKSDSLNVANSTAAGSITYDRKTNGFAFSYKPSDVLQLRVNYQTVTNGDAATLATGTSVKGYSAKVLGLGADYALSKRTTVYGRYEKDTDSTGAFRSITGYTAVGTNTTYTATAIGIRHTF